jgi:hypothetical protein
LHKQTKNIKMLLIHTVKSKIVHPYSASGRQK